MLRIAHLHWGFPPIIGGVETHLTMLLPEIVKRGHHVGLLTGAAQGRPEREDYFGVDVHRTPLMDLNWLYARGLEALEEEIDGAYANYFEAVKPDVIHCHNMHYFSEPHARRLDEIAYKMGVPLVLTVHNVWDDITFLKLTREVAWAHIIAVSYYIKMELIGVGCPDEIVTTIHHGIDTNRFRPDVKPDRVLERFPQLRGKRIVLHPARMGLAKGCDVTIKAMRLVRQRMPDAMLVLTGTRRIIDWGLTQQKDIAYFIDLIKLLGLREGVLIDIFDLSDMPELYAAAHVVVYPSSQSEPFGLAMLEAMASGKPIIVTRIGGMPEIIQNAIYGYVVPTRNFEELAARIIDLLDDERLRRRIGSSGRDITRLHYTKEIMTERNIEVYRSVISKGGGQSV